MKKLLAVLLVLMMSLASLGAFAEETEPALPALEIPAFTVTSSLSLDQEMAAQLLPLFVTDEAQLGMIMKVLPVVGNLGARLTAADGGVQADIRLKDADVASIAVAQTEDGFALVSDVIPSYVITVSNETIKNLTEQFTSQLSGALENVDMNAVMNAVMSYGQEYMEALQGAMTFGEPEVGEYEFEGVAFNIKMPMNVDMKAVALAQQTIIKKLLQDDAIAPLLQSFGGALNTSNLDESIDAIQGLPEEQTPALDLAIYTCMDAEGNAINNNVCVDGKIDTKTDEVGDIALNVLVIESAVKATIDMPKQQVNLVIAGSFDGQDVKLGLDVNAMGVYVGLVATGSLNEAGLHIEEQMYFMTDEKPLLTSVTDVAQGGERTLPFDTEGKTVLTIEELMNDKEGTLAQGLLMDAMSNGLASLIAKASSVMPDEVTGLVNLVMGVGEGTAEQ